VIGMSRKREGYAANWGTDRVLRQLGEDLVDADDAAIDAKAEELGTDPRRLWAFVLDARRRRKST